MPPRSSPPIWGCPGGGIHPRRNKRWRPLGSRGGRSPMRSIHDLTTEEAYRLVHDHFGHELPPLEAVENEDWGRDYVLQCLLQHTPEELAELGLADAPG